MNLAAKTCSGCLNPAARRLGPKKDAGAQPPRINAAGLHPGLGCTGAFPRVRRTHTLPSRCPGALALPACLPRVPSRGGNSPAGACVLLLPCSIQRGPRVSGDPAPPSQRRANREAAGGAFSPRGPPTRRASRAGRAPIGWRRGRRCALPIGCGRSASRRGCSEAAGERAHVPPRLQPCLRARAPGRARARGGGSREARLRRLWDCAPPSRHPGRRRPRASLGGTRVPACRTASPTLGPPRSSRHSVARRGAARRGPRQVR